MVLNAQNIDALYIESIDVVVHRRGERLTRRTITDAGLIKKIQAACSSSRSATCEMGTHTGPKYFLELKEEAGRRIGTIEVGAHSVVIGNDIVYTPSREVWVLVERGLHPSKEPRELVHGKKK